MSLLDKDDEAAEDVWELIRMLATNENIYREVLSLESAKDSSGKIEWTSFFENASVYKRIYNLEIIEAVMEEGDE